MKYSSIRRERIENNEIYISIKYIKQNYFSFQEVKQLRYSTG